MQTDPGLLFGGLGVMVALAGAVLVLSHLLRLSRQHVLALSEEEQRWALALEGAGHAVWDWKLLENRLHVSRGWEQLVGSTSSSNEPASREARIHPDDVAKVNGLIQKLLSGEWISYESEHRMRTDDGRDIWVRERGRLVERDQASRPARIVATVEDISDRRANQAHIEYLASHDALTGLPNRSLLNDRIGQALARADRQRHMVAVIFLDLDHFKNINDTLGHSAGDELLVKLAQSLSLVLRKMDTLSRRGGDEFVVLLPEVRSPSEVSAVCEKLLATLREPIWVADREVHVSASMGVAMYPVDAKNAEALLQLADVAMYRSKQEGRRCYTFFATEMNRSLRGETEFEIRLRRAMADGFLAMWYQPQYNLRNGVVTGAEALMRWIEPDGTSVAPNQFIPLAEKLGLIHAIGEWALYEACRQSQEWRRQLGKAMPVAVNVSPHQFRRPGLYSTIERALQETGLPPEDLIIEIAESVVMEDLVVTQQTLRALLELGVRLAIDDFGTGLASLAHLKRFPVHHLKIDRSFVQDLGRSSEDEVMVRTIIQLGHSLHLSVAAKGVETAAQAALLRAHGCDYAQGYLYSVPLPKARFMALLGAPEEAVSVAAG